MKTFPSNSVTVDCARMLEMKEIEARASQERTKKYKVKGTFNGQGSGTSSKGSKNQAQRETPQWILRSIG